MKDWAVRDWILVCLLFQCMKVNTMPPACPTNGAIRVRGTVTDGFQAGYINMCEGGQWRAICDGGWDIQDARVACRQLSFTGAESCTGSCAGRNDNLRGLEKFDCHGNETRLQNCEFTNASNQDQERIECGRDNHAGILCYNAEPCPTETPQCTTSTTEGTPASTGVTSATDTDEGDCSACTEMSESTKMTHQRSTEAAKDQSMERLSGGGGCIAIGIALGSLSAALLLLLIALITGWVWSRHRNKASATKSRAPRTMFANPAYTQSSSHLIPAIQYSSTGPRDTPTNCHTPPQEERIYHVLEQPEGEGERRGGEEGEYQEIEQGMAYEVPIQTKKVGRDESAGRAGEMTYSTLHHN